MARKVYVGTASEKANLVNQIYVGVDGTAKQVIKGYVGVNGEAKLFYFRFLEKTFSSSIFPRSWSGNTGTNSYGTWTVSGGWPYTSSYKVSNAFDGSKTTAWRGQTEAATDVTISCPTNVFIKPTRIYCYTSGQASNAKISISGYLDSEGTVLYSNNFTGPLNGSFSISTTKFFNSFDVSSVGVRTLAPYVYELDVTAGVVKYNG